MKLPSNLFTIQNTQINLKIIFNFKRNYNINSL
uniref:Uncharacterized protein n=1 Tax=Anguilla anguilla TaxID=7936 RepID=A0A0E9PUL5_ANGAN